MKEIAILAIARYGDLIQMTPLLRVLKKRWPDSRITLIVEDRFSGILPMIRGFDRTIILRKKDIAVDIILQDDPLVPYKSMDDFVRKVEADRYDLLINLTCTKFGAHLTSLMDKSRVNGFTADGKGRRSIESPWGLFVFSWFYDNARKFNRINLVDVFTRLGDVMPDGNRVELFETDEGRNFAEQFLVGEKAENARLVGLQLGASEPNRCWPLENFALLSDRLQTDFGVKTIMFGSPGEKHLAEKAKEFMQIPAIDAVGKTSLEGLYSLVRRCSALVSNDTGTMHFAAAGGVPAVMLCIGPAFFRGTGPYGAGHLALQPDLPCSPCPYDLRCANPVCRTAITPESVYNACDMLLNGGVPDAWQGVRVYGSRFSDDGYLTWDPVVNVEERQEKSGRGFEKMWKCALDGTGTNPNCADDTMFPELYRLMEKGAGITTDIISAARRSPVPVDRIKDLGDREAAVESELKLMGRRHPELTLMINFLTLMRENIFSEELVPLTEETRKVYETGKKMASFL